MAKEIRTEIRINASPSKVWAILTDFANYPQWNPFIKSISGDVAQGKKFKVYMEPPGARGMGFSPTVLAFQPEKEFKWIGHLLFKGLFDGEHKFELKNNGDGSTTFIQSEKFGGILIPLFTRMLDINTVNGFNLMNQKLKEWAEK